MRLTEAPSQYSQGVLPFTILRDTEHIHRLPTGGSPTKHLPDPNQSAVLSG